MAYTARESIERMREIERLERDERRGLEARAATAIGALLIAIGLVANSDVAVTATYGTIAGALAAIALLSASFPLVGLHATFDEPTLRGSIVAALMPSSPSRVPLPDADLDRELEHQQLHVNALVKRNATAVYLLRISTFLALLAAYTILVGLIA